MKKRLFFYLYLLLLIGLVSAAIITEVLMQSTAPQDQEANRYTREMARGQIYHLVHDLKLLPESRWAAQLAEWQPHYGLQLRLLPRQQLSAEWRARLQQEDFLALDEGERFICEVRPGAALVLQLQTPALPEGSLWLQILANVLMGGLLALIVFLWTRWQWRDLEHLRQAAERFGRGEFSSRASVPRHAAVHELARHFNQMASQIEQLISSQKELLNAVSHELRTPLSRLKFELEALRAAPLPANDAAMLEYMGKDLQEMEALIAELLSYTRLEQMPNALSLQDIAAQDWLEQVLGTVALEAQARQIDCRIVTPLPEQITLEPKLMARALTNLLCNAIRHARQRVEIRLECLESQCCLRVDDDGPGVPTEAAERIFLPFVRLDTSRNRDTGGYGLGLAIVQRIAEKHRGQIAVTTSSLGGACFKLSWPNKSQPRT